MTTRIWRFADPRDFRFAQAGRRGSWSVPPERGVCPECTGSRERRVQPLVLEWLPGCDVVGDFTWPGYGHEVVATEQVLASLQKRFSGFEPGPVEMVQDPKLKQSARSKPRVWLPYEGPPLYELWVTTWVHIDPGRSSAELERRCGTCGTEYWHLYGVERWDSDFDRDRMELVRTHSDRLPGAGVFVPESDLAGSDVFRVHEFPGPVFCTDRVRDFVTEQGYTNVSFLEMGETF